MLSQASTLARRPATARPSSLPLPGRMVLPGDEEWDLARRPWNLAARQRPRAVALPESADEVRSIVELARTRGLRIAPQATGHGALSLGSLEDTILLSTRRMRGARINPTARRASVQAGATWGEVARAAAEHGPAGLAGSSPTVGVVGYSLGGGIGWLARRYGLAANSILAAEIVTGDGRYVRTDHEHEPDLIWALRGGSGNFGIVTALEFALYPVGEMYGGALFWPLERASEILHAWRAWTHELPDEITSIARIRRMPSRAHIPARLRGHSFAIVEAAYIGAEANATELLRPLRALGPPIDTFQTRSMTELGPLHLDPQEPMARIADGYLLADFPPAAVDAMLAGAKPGAGSPLASVELRHLGGALARRSSLHGALGSLDAAFAVYAVGMAATPELIAPLEHAIDVLRDALASWVARRRCPNFADRADPNDLYPAKTLDRLREINAAHDPHELIRSNRPIVSSDHFHHNKGERT